MRNSGSIAGFLVVLHVAQPAVAQGTGAGSAPGYELLNDGFGTLRDDFNHAKGSVRLLFVVDPICPGCLRGMDDLNRDLLAGTSDTRLQTFVVHVPVIGAKAKDVLPAAKLLQNSNVRHYWNASGAFGRSLATSIGLRNDKKLVYAWDVWLLYGPDAEWTGATPPQPLLLMHQIYTRKISLTDIAAY